MLVTERLRLCLWNERHFGPFADMHKDPDVMADLGGPYSEATSREKFDRFVEAQAEHGIARWAVEDNTGAFLGYAGVMPQQRTDLPMGPHYEIGWRFIRSAWGCGYASESAKAALDHALNSAGLDEVIAYASRDNLRSQAVMARIGLTRKPSWDFRITLKDGRDYDGLVWSSSQ